MANLIQEVKYIKADLAHNNNKYWYAELYDDATTITRNGRVGAGTQVHPKRHSSQSAALSYFQSKIIEKERKKYKPLNVIGQVGQVGQVRKQNIVGDLLQIARSQIKSNNSIVGKLIDYFTRVNAHNICAATNGQITFSNTTGLFSTPLGIVTQDNIDGANRLLIQIGAKVADSDYDYRLEGLTNEYMMLVPQNVGSRRVEVRSLWHSISAVQRQKQIVDSLQASLLQVSQAPVVQAAKKDAEQVFDVQLDLVVDPKIIEKIKKQYDGSRNNRHNCSHLKVKTVYAVSIASANQAFENQGKAIGNVKRLWHGTRASNVLSILKAGLVIPPSSSSHCTGRSFGDGLYFSDQSTKSLNYSHGGTWGGSIDNNCFMFLCQVAMGKSYIPTANDYIRRFPVTGYDSTFAKAGQRFLNNEQIVYKTCQAQLQYLIEFAP